MSKDEDFIKRAQEGLNNGTARLIGEASRNMPNVQLNLNPLTAIALSKAIPGGLDELYKVGQTMAIIAKLTDEQDEQHTKDSLESVAAMMDELTAIGKFLDQVIFNEDGNPDVLLDTTGDDNTEVLEAMRRAERAACEKVGLSNPKDSKPNLSVVKGGNNSLH